VEAPAEMCLRDRKRCETRQRIVDTGRRLFSEKGFEATTLDAIALEAGISRRTFFSYFTSKEDVLLDTCRSAVGAIWPSVLSSSVSICSESVLAQRLTRESQPMSGFDAPAICKADSTSAAASPSAATTGLSPSLLFRNAASSPSHERDLRFCSSRPNSRTN